eukprot:gene9725-11941_t
MISDALPYIVFLFTGPAIGMFSDSGNQTSITAGVYSYLADISKEESRSKLFTYVGISGGIGAIVGPAIMIVYSKYANTLAIYISIFVMLTLSMVVVFLFLKESLPAFQNENGGQIKSTLQTNNPLVQFKNIFSSSYISLMVLFYATTYAVIMGINSVNYIYSVERFDWGQTMNAVSTVCVGVSTILTGAFFPYTLKFFSERKVLIGSFFYAILIVALFGLSFNQWFFLVITFICAPMGLNVYIMASMISNSTNEDNQASVIGGMKAVAAVLSFAFSIATQKLFSYFISNGRIYLPGAPFYFCAFIILLILIGVIVLFRFHKEKMVVVSPNENSINKSRDDVSSCLLSFKTGNLIYFYVVHSIGGNPSGITAVVYSYISDISTPESITKLFTYLGVGSGIGGIIGPLAMILFAKISNNNYTFIALFGVLVVALIVVVAFIKETLPRLCKKTRDLYKDSNGNSTKKKTSINPFISLKALVSSGYLLCLVLFYSVLYTCIMGLNAVNYIYCFERYGWEETMNSISTVVVAVATIFIGILSPIVIGKFSERKVLIVSFLYTIGYFVWSAVSKNQWLFLVAQFFGSAITCVMYLMASMISKSAAPEYQASVMGGMKAVSSLTSFAGSIACQALFSYFISNNSPVYLPGAPFYFCSALLALTLIGVFIVFRVYSESDVERLKNISSKAAKAAEDPVDVVVSNEIDYEDIIDDDDEDSEENEHIVEKKPLLSFSNTNLHKGGIN